MTVSRARGSNSTFNSVPTAWYFSYGSKRVINDFYPILDKYIQSRYEALDRAVSMRARWRLSREAVAIQSSE